MAKQSNPIAKYWSGIHKALDNRLESAREMLRHPASGGNAELYFRQMLTDYMPRRYAIESGFVVNAAGARSDFMDVLIVDAMNIAPLSAEPGFKVFPAESVVGAMEITSSPKSRAKRKGIPARIPKLADDALKLAKLREIARQRVYFVHAPVDDYSSPPAPAFETMSIAYELSPRCFLVVFGDEWSKREAYEKNLMMSLQIAQRHSNFVWVNAALSLKHGLHIFRRHTEFEHKHDATNPLLEFFLFVNRSISSVPTGSIDVGRYRPTTPDVDEKAVPM